MKVSKKIWFVAALFAASTMMTAAGCGGGGDAGPKDKKSSSKKSDKKGDKKKKKREAFPSDKATATVSGSVMFEGDKPTRKKLLIQGDDYCVAQHPSAPLKEDMIIADDGSMENVFVYIKRGADKWEFDTPSDPVKVTQKGCVYIPHVFGIMAGQPLEVTSGDNTTHNVHFVGEKNDEFNLTQKMNQTDTKNFARQEVMAKLKCDIHSWMEAHVGILYHPFFAVTGTDGKFELPKLPAGKYQVEAWHEKLGTKTETIEITDGENKTVEFKFSKG